MNRHPAARETAATLPPVNATRSSNVSLNTAFGVPAAAQISPARDTTIQIESTENGRHAPFLPSMNSILHCEMDNQFPGLYVANRWRYAS
jgi:hypothetical protein